MVQGMWVWCWRGGCSTGYVDVLLWVRCLVDMLLLWVWFGNGFVSVLLQGLEGGGVSVDFRMSIKEHRPTHPIAHPHLHANVPTTTATQTPHPHTNWSAHVLTTTPTPTQERKP